MTTIAVLGSLFVALLVIGLIVSRIARRRLERHDQPEPFTLHDLRRMRDCGQITEREFDAMRAGLLKRARAPASPPAGPPGRSPPASDTRDATG